MTYRNNASVLGAWLASALAISLTSAAPAQTPAPAQPQTPAPAPAQPAAPMPPQKTVQNFTPVTDEMLRAPKPDDWLMLRHDYAVTSYSPLTQIKVGNASRVEIAWTWPMRSGR